jgi:aminomethyltransferase
MGFMDSRVVPMFGAEAIVSRSGYTGEDGYEISVMTDVVCRVWDTLLKDARVRPIGLGARDSLRLEAGLPLYGHDIDENTSPIEAGLGFALSKRRLEAGDFPGARRVRAEKAEGPQRKLVGLRIKEGAPAREGADVIDEYGGVICRVTSGGPSPTLGIAIAMAYVPPANAELGTMLKVRVRGRDGLAEVVATPFVPHRYYRKPKS